MRSFLRWMMAMSLGLGAALAAAQQPNVAATPPMGWNSWDAYGLTITEPQFRANVVVERDKLLPYGWNYAVIDEGWFFENPQDRRTPDKLRYGIDPYGRYVPVPSRFPTATEAGTPRPIKSTPAGNQVLTATIENTSFVALSSWVHSQGMKFGVHIVRGIPRASVERNMPIAGSKYHAADAANQNDACPWDPTNWGVRNNEAGQAWYDSLIRQYADWGVDLVKVDCISDNPYAQYEIYMIYRAIKKTGRPMVLSLSPGPTSLDHAVEVSRLANMWRISDDIWDLWSQPPGAFPQGIKEQFVRAAAWAKYTKPGHWPDADMLPLGELRPSPGWGVARTSRLTPDEQRMQVTLWAIARSPLIVGANLTQLDQHTLELLTNRDVIAIDQTALTSFEVRREHNLFAWRANLPDGKVALAIFNVGDTPMKIDRQLAEFVGDHGVMKWAAHNVWTNQDMGSIRKLQFDIPRHGCVLLELHRVRAESQSPAVAAAGR